MTSPTPTGEVSGWQPIETAPKDGTTIIGWAETMLEPVTIRWKSETWQSVWELARVLETESDFGTSYKDPDWPTHWQPLPEPPK